MLNLILSLLEANFLPFQLYDVVGHALAVLQCFADRGPFEAHSLLPSARFGRKYFWAPHPFMGSRGEFAARGA